MSYLGKKILFIAPRFFGYEKLIKAELEASGAQVDYFDDRPGGDFLTKALIRVDRRLLAGKTNRYYGDIAQSTKGKDYDFILIVRAEAISADKLRELKSVHGNAKVILYLWDSMNYNPNAKALIPLFDKVLSFDREDAAAYSGVHFLPLFYAKGFASTEYPRVSFEYDACFIGTVHTDRYKVVKRIAESLEAQGKKVFLYCFYPSKTLYRLRCLVDRGFREFGEKHIKFESIPLSKTIEYFDSSESIIDVNRPEQLGLTMRTVETFGARRKLITTNEDVKNYDLYAAFDVCVVDREKPYVPYDFLNGHSSKIDEAVWKNYSVGQWLNSIFGVE